MIFLPHTNTVILLEPYCGTMTEPGLPVVRGGNWSKPVTFYFRVFGVKIVALTIYSSAM